MTAHVQNWTDGTDTMDIVDNESTNLVVIVPSQATEGAGILINAGTVSILGILTNNLIVSLGSSDTSEVTVATSTTITAGQTSSVFNITIVDDSECDGVQTGRITVSAAGFASGSDSIDVMDNDAVGPLDHFQWSNMTSLQCTNVPFAVTIMARDATNCTVTGFTNAVNVHGQTGGGSNQVGIGSGSAGWIYPMSTYYQDARTQIIYMTNEIGSARTLNGLALNVLTVPGHTMTNWTIRMKHTTLTNYPASPVWEGTGWTTVRQTNEPPGSTGWRSFSFSTPFAYNGTNNVMIDFSFNTAAFSTDGSCESTTTNLTRSIYKRTDSLYGDPLSWSGTNPPCNQSQNIPNIRLMSGGTTPVATIPPVSGNFVNGVWTGTLTVADIATDLVLIADDGSGHTGNSIPFEVGPAYWLDLQVDSHGSLDKLSGWFHPATNAVVTAMPYQYYHFGLWTGDTNGCGLADNVITAYMNRTRGLVATMNENLATNSTPEWWLASWGLTNGWNNEAVGDQDTDGMQAWQEYVAGTCPTNPGDRLAIAQWYPVPMSSNKAVLSWQSVNGKIYDLFTTTNMRSQWNPVSDASCTNVPGTGQRVTCTNSYGSDTQRFFRLRVQR